MSADTLYTLTEAAAQLGLSPNTLRAQIKRGKLTARLVGKTYIVTAGEIGRYRRENLGRVGRPKETR